MSKISTTATLAASAVFTLAGIAATHAAEVTVGNFGQHDWYSSDTRASDGANLRGASYTQPYLILRDGAIAGDDAKIAQQISFVDGPDGVGSVMLNATDNNNGKANLSTTDTVNGFGNGTALLDDNFILSYRSYNEPMTTSRTLGISIALIDPNNPTSVYTFSYTGVSEPINTWIINSADRDSDWRLYGNGTFGAAPGSSQVKSLTDWAQDPTFAAILSADYTVFEVGFNLGSYQRNNNTYVDWFQSSLVNGGDKVNFVPEPASFSILALGGLTLLARRRHNRA